MASMQEVEQTLQMSNIGLALVAQALALGLAIVSVFVAIYLNRGFPGRQFGQRTLIAQWVCFFLAVAGLQIETQLLLLSVGHYPDIIGVIPSSVFPGASYWISRWPHPSGDARRSREEDKGQGARGNESSAQPEGTSVTRNLLCCLIQL